MKGKLHRYDENALKAAINEMRNSLKLRETPIWDFEVNGAGPY